MAAIAAMFCCEAVAGANCAPVYQYQTRLARYSRPEWAYIPGVGNVPVECESEWSAGRYCTFRTIRYVCPGKVALWPEFVDKSATTSRISYRLTSTPVYDYLGRLVAHRCEFRATDVSIDISWWPEFYP